MAVKTYLQVAITQVQNALTDMQNQTHGIRQSADGTKSQLQKDCAKLEQERVLHQTALSRQTNDTQKHALLGRISQINAEMDTKKAHMGQIDTDVAHTQARKDQLRKDLYNVQVELTRLMSLPDIG